LAARGSPYGRFRHALDRGNVLEALSAAAELRHVSLVDALALLLLLARKDLVRFQRAALRWHARYCDELRVYDAGEAQVTLALLFMLAGPSSSAVARALAELLQARDFGQAAETLTAWAEESRRGSRQTPRL
jgi:hypothetical protein